MSRVAPAPPPPAPVSVAPTPKPEPAPPAPSPASPAPLSAPPAPAPPPAVDEGQLAARVLADLQRQLDLMLEVRLREALAPVLARVADTLIRDARKELTTAMQDAVARTLAQELARRNKG